MESETGRCTSVLESVSRNLTTKEMCAAAMEDYQRDLLYQHIRGETSLDKLMEVFFDENPKSPEMFSARNLAAIAERASRIGWSSDFPGEHRLNELSRACAKVVDQFETKELATTAQAFELMMPPCAFVVFEAIAREAPQRAIEFDPADLVVLAQAFAFARMPYPTLFQAISVAILPSVDLLDGTQLAHLAISFAMVDFRAPILFDAIAPRATMRVREIERHLLAQTLCAFAKVDSKAPKLFLAVAYVFLEDVEYFSEESLAQAVWAFAQSRTKAPRNFFYKCLKSILRAECVILPGEDKAKAAWAFRFTKPNGLFDRLGLFDSCDDVKDVVDLARVFVESDVYYERFFTDAAKACWKNIDRLSATRVADAAWAFTLAALNDDKVRPINEKRSIYYQFLFTEIASVAVEKIEDFNAHNMSTLAVSFARLNSFPSSKLFASISVSASARITEFAAHDLAMIAWAFTKAQLSSPTLFSTIATEAVARNSMQCYSESTLVNFAFSFAKSGVASPAFFNAIGRAALPMLHQFTAKSLSRLAWAFAMVCSPRSTFLQTVIFFATNFIDSFDPIELAMTSWALASLVRAPTPQAPSIRLVLDSIVSNSVDSFNERQRSQLYLFVLLARLEHPLLYQSVDIDQEYESTLQAAYVQTSSTGPRKVKLKKIVSDILTEIEWIHEEDFVTEEGLQIDIVQRDSKRAVRILYPSSFCQDSETGKFYENGTSRLHSRLLRGLGWSVSYVKFFDLVGLPSGMIRANVTRALSN